MPSMGVLMGNFGHSDICWKDYTSRHTQSRRFLQSTDDNFLMRVGEEPTRRLSESSVGLLRGLKVQDHEILPVDLA